MDPSGKFLIVRSSAGSGKTYRLVFEYLRLALGSANSNAYRRILAVTFTNKAAQEMLERVLEELAALAAPENAEHSMAKGLTAALGITEELLVERAAATLEHMLHNFGNLSISTIDRFVNRVVRAFARDLKVTANYEIELEESRLLEEAVDRCISDIEQGSPMANALVQLMLDLSDEERSWRIEKGLYTTAKNLLNEKGHQYLSAQSDIGIEGYQLIRKELRKKMRIYQNALMDIGKKALAIIVSTDISPEMFAGGRSGVPIFFRRLSVFDKIIEPTATVSNNIVQDKWYSGKATPEDKANIDSIKSTLEELFHQALELIEEKHPAYLEMAMISERLTALGVLSEVEMHLNELKDEQDILLISDLNKMISKVVLNEPAPFIYERTGERYSNLLFDEFQDTSLMQWQNFLPLVENALSKNGFSLVVGDGKQAIYRWRNGEVQQFLHLPKIFGHNNAPAILEKEAILERHAEFDVLETNYRSSPEVIDLNNRLFTAMSAQLPGALKKIYADHEQKVHKKEVPGYVRIQQILPEDDVSSTELILQKLVTDIRELATESENDIQAVTQKEENINKPLLNNIAILVRTGQQGRTIATFLESEGINVISPEALLLSAHTGVNMLMDLLAFLYDTNNLIAGTRFVTAAAHSKNIDGNLHTFLTRYIKRIKRGTHIDIDGLLLREFGIENSRSMRTLPTLELATMLAAGLELLKNNDPYIIHLLDQILQVSTQQGSGLLSLLEWWETNWEKAGLSIPEGQDAVKLMTIHKSKGLQFPVVMVPFTDWSTSTRADNDLWLHDPAKTYGLEHLLVKAKKDLESTRFADQYAHESELNLLDSMNMLYVAYTRAERVLISYCGKGNKGTINNMMLPALQEMPEWNAEQMSFILGEIPNIKNENDKSNNEFALNSMSPTNWYGRAVMESSSLSQDGQEEGSSHLEYGKIVHDVMMGIRTKADIGVALERKDLDEQQVVELQEKVATLIALPEVAPYFIEGLNTMDEREICTTSGRSLRPDRVVIEGNKATILEYKTGDERPAHLEQVNVYARELEEMGYKVTEKIILYIDQGRAIRA